jgi:hypothetical protein
MILPSTIRPPMVPLRTPRRTEKFSVSARVTTPLHGY